MEFLFKKRYWGAAFYVFCRERGLSEEECSNAMYVLYKVYLDNSESVRLFPGVKKLFAALEKMGIKKALLTNTHRWVIERVVAKLGLNFDSMPDMSKITPKPNPEGIFRVCNELGIKKEEAVFVGDTETDAKTGENAGVKTLIVGNDIANIGGLLKQI